MNHDRNEKAFSMRKDGKTFREIGEFFSVSSNRAMQMCRDAERRRKNPPNPIFESLRTRTRNALFAELGKNPSTEKIRQCVLSDRFNRIPELGKVGQCEVLRLLSNMEAGGAN